MPSRAFCSSVGETSVANDDLETGEVGRSISTVTVAARRGERCSELRLGESQRGEPISSPTRDGGLPPALPAPVQREGGRLPPCIGLPGRERPGDVFGDGLRLSSSLLSDSSPYSAWRRCRARLAPSPRRSKLCRASRNGLIVSIPCGASDIAPASLLSHLSATRCRDAAATGRLCAIEGAGRRLWRGARPPRARSRNASPRTSLASSALAAPRRRRLARHSVTS